MVKLMIIYKFDCECYSCKNKISYYTYLIFREYENDVVFPLDMNFVRLVYSEMPSNKDDPYFDINSDELNFPIKVLGDDEEYDDQIIKSGHFPNIRIFDSTPAKRAYAANFCVYCGKPLGNYFLREKVTDQFLKPNIPMKIYCEI